MSVGIHLRSQKRLSFVIDACYHMTCGDFEDFLHVVSADILRAMDCGEITLWAMVDFSKCFDMVTHDRLI